MTYSASLFGVNSKLENMKIVLVGAILSNTSIQKFDHIRDWGSKNLMPNITSIRVFTEICQESSALRSTKNHRTVHF